LAAITLHFTVSLRPISLRRQFSLVLPFGGVMGLWD
jgi:hypothetical protein